MIPKFVIRRDTLIMSLGISIYRHMELIKIHEKEGKKLVDARELHGYLVKSAKGGQKGEDFSNWIKRMLAHGFELNVDFTTIGYDYKGNTIELNGEKLSESDNQQVSKRDFALLLDTAKQIAMIQNNDKGRQARRYFIECEKKVNNQFAIPQTLSEALLLASKQAERIEQLEVKEKVVDRLLSSNTAITITEFAKCYCDELHNIGGKRLFSLLRDRKHLINSKGNLKHNTPYQKYINSGYYIVIQKEYKRGDKDSYALQTLVTPKGQEWLLSNLDKLL